MWSNKLPDLDTLYSAPQALFVFDAIMKRYYLTNYGLKPKDVDEIPDRLLQTWQKIAEEEKRKKDNEGS